MKERLRLIALTFSLGFFVLGILGLSADGSAFQRGDFVKYPELFIMVTFLDLVFLKMLINAKYSRVRLVVYLMMGLISIFLTLFFIFLQLPISNQENKIFDLILLSLISVYNLVVCISIIKLIKDFEVNNSFKIIKTIKIIGREI